MLSQPAGLRWAHAVEHPPVGLPERDGRGNSRADLSPSLQRCSGHVVYPPVTQRVPDRALGRSADRHSLRNHPFPRDSQGKLYNWVQGSVVLFPVASEAVPELSFPCVAAVVLPVAESQCLRKWLCCPWCPPCHLWLIFNQLTFTEGFLGT